MQTVALTDKQKANPTGLAYAGKPTNSPKPDQQIPNAFNFFDPWLARARKITAESKANL